jgi:hemerythrin
MAMQWTNTLSVGIEAIDDQHKEIFAKANSLMEACQQGKGKQVAGEIIGFLNDYVAEHFSGEEKLMLKHNYADYKTHKDQHENFANGFKDLKSRFEAEGPGLQIVVLTNKTIVNWLVTHINSTDKKLGAFLKELSDSN